MGAPTIIVNDGIDVESDLVLFLTWYFWIHIPYA